MERINCPDTVIYVNHETIRIDTKIESKTFLIKK